MAVSNPVKTIDAHKAYLRASYPREEPVMLSELPQGRDLNGCILLWKPACGYVTQGYKHPNVTHKR